MVIANKTIKINGVDCTEFFKEDGYAIGEKFVQGDNAGPTLSGDTVEDILSIKDVVSLPLEPLSETDVVFLMDLLRNSEVAPYVQIYYFSTNYGEYRESTFIREELTNTHMFTSSLGVDYYKSNELHFIEA